MNYSKQTIEAVLKLKKAGFSHRDISMAVFGRRTSASSVFYILDEHYYVREEKVAPDGAKVLIFDIETAPEKAYVWGRWKQNVGVPQVIERSYMLSWAAKWFGTEEIFADALPFYDDYEIGVPSDRGIIESLWFLLDEADVVIAHNGIKFDLAYANSRFAYYGMGMPSPFKVIDTLKVAKKYFRFPANSLAELCAYFGIETKLDTKFTLWTGCMNGDKESWNEMVEYNMRDITALEGVYLKLRPFDKGTPAFNLYYADELLRCPACGGTHLNLLKKNAYTAMSAFESYRCECGHVSRTNKRVKKGIITNAQ